MTIASITIQDIDTRPQYDPMTNIAGMTTYTMFWLDCRDRTCGVSQEMHDNSTTSAIYHGHMLTCKIDGHPSESMARETIEQNTDLIARIVTGYESQWNGNNHIAIYTDDARAAWEELQRQLEYLQPHYEFWQTDEWLYPAMETDIHADTSDEQIAQLAADWMTTDDHIILDNDLDYAVKYITDYRNDKRDEADYAADRHTS